MALFYPHFIFSGFLYRYTECMGQFLFILILQVTNIQTSSSNLVYHNP